MLPPTARRLNAYACPIELEGSRCRRHHHNTAKYGLHGLEARHAIDPESLGSIDSTLLGNYLVLRYKQKLTVLLELLACAVANVLSTLLCCVSHALGCALPVVPSLACLQTLTLGCA